MKPPVLVLLVALAAAPALAAETPPSDAPVATADDQAGTAAQVEAWIHSAPAVEARADATAEPPPVVSDRKPHGVVSVGVGTRGYRSVYARTDLPLGDAGRLSIAVADSRFGGRRDEGYGYAHGSPAFALGPGAPLAGRQRCDLEGMTPARPLDVTGGPNGRCAEPLAGW